MRILNRRQLNDIPMVDAGSVNLDRTSMGALMNREKIAAAANAALKMAQLARARANHAAYVESQHRLAQSQIHGAMLQRSLRNTGHAVVAAAQRQGNGNVPRYGITNPTMGFVPGSQPNHQINTPEFAQNEVMKAQEFSNLLTSHKNPQFAKFKDYPLVMDAPKGDFGGVLVKESGAADFSEWIVHNDSKDFGHVPQRRQRLLRRR